MITTCKNQFPRFPFAVSVVLFSFKLLNKPNEKILKLTKFLSILKRALFITIMAVGT
jgi:hypothetical protein